MTRTLPADLEMGIAQQTTRGVARTLVLELMADEEKRGKKDEWGRSIKLGVIREGPEGSSGGL